jgi:hypothetical protein
MRVHTANDHTGVSTWTQFQSLHPDWGKGGNTTQRRESNKAKKERLKGEAKNKRKLKKTNQNRYEQLDLAGDTRQRNDAEAFADIMRHKPLETTRIGFQNIQLLPENSNHYKSRQLVNHIIQAQLDGFLINEVGLNWNAVEPGSQWSEQTFGKLMGNQGIFAHNSTELDTTETIQYGGVGIVTTQELSSRIIEYGRDPTNLGRWVWIRLQGKEGHTTRLVTAYRPCESPGASTVFHQQARGLSVNDDHRNPRDAILEDLAESIAQWQAAGDHIIVGMDANEDIRNGEVNATFSRLGLKEAILDRHKDKSPPATQNRNTNRQPIDGLWVSGCIHISADGYLPFGDACPSDHRMSWIEIQYSDIFGHKSPELAKLQPKRLKTSDPRLMKRFNRRVKNTMTDKGFRQRFQAYTSAVENSPWSDLLLTQYNALNQEDHEIRAAVESNIRKLTMGEVPWSPNSKLTEIPSNSGE